MSDAAGVLIIDKEKDFTSFDVIAILRRLLGTKKLGHTGTLDPMATGVLPVLVGRATRAEAILPDTDKEYLAGFRLGLRTDTQDITGKVLSQRKAEVSAEELAQACEGFRGDIMQVPPMYSAVKKNGARLYELARQGVEVERQPRPVSIRRLEVVSYDRQAAEGTLLVACSKGTYIRTLCEDIGNRLGCGGVMTSLRRTKAAGFCLDAAITIGQARILASEGTLCQRILPVERLFLCYPAIQVTAGQAIRFKNGGGLALERLPHRLWKTEEIVRVQDPGGVFLGLGLLEPDRDELKVLRLFF